MKLEKIMFCLQYIFSDKLAKKCHWNVCAELEHIVIRWILVKIEYTYSDRGL